MFSGFPYQVNYRNAHAMSTFAGDLAEINTLKQAFKKPDGVKINATKFVIGHYLGSSGGLEAIATVKAITTGWLHPSINQLGARFHRSINQAAWSIQFAPRFAALNSQMMSSDASQRVNQLIIAESCNLSNEAPRPSSNTAINQNMQAVPYHRISSP